MLCELDQCTGCMACYSSCSKIGAIQMIEDERGFKIPIIDKKKCIKCGKCNRVCPILNNSNILNLEEKKPSVKACWNKNKKIRKMSTSGGIFFEVASWVIDNNGVVFGACFNEKFNVIHSYIENKDEIKKMQGSKYVQSYIGDTFKEAEMFLKQDRIVLFTGTPCQIAGLKSYLGKPYKKLITLDIVCHGVPSPLIFEKYLEFITGNRIEEVRDIQFRYKKPSWTVFSMKIDYKNNETYISDTYKDPFLVGFLSNYFSRPCCYKCNYTNINRYGDLTIGDFWGYISEKKELRNTEEGISLVLINSTRGKEIIDIIQSNLIITDKTLEEAMDGNRCLDKPYGANQKESEFWEIYKKNNKFEDVNRIYLAPKKIKLKRKVSLAFNDNAYLIPNKLRNTLLDVKKKIRR